MTRKESERQTRQVEVLESLGFSTWESEQLRRISVRLQHWYEKECGIDGGCIERDEETHKTFWHDSMSGRRYQIADLETGAVKRLARIVDNCNKARLTHMTEGKMTPQEGLRFYLQTDPRGATLYIIRPGDVPEGQDVNSYYTRGICVY